MYVCLFSQVRTTRPRRILDILYLSTFYDILRYISLRVLRRRRDIFFHASHTFIYEIYNVSPRWDDPGPFFLLEY